MRLCNAMCHRCNVLNGDGALHVETRQVVLHANLNGSLFLILRCPFLGETPIFQGFSPLIGWAMAKWDRDLTQVCFEILSYSQSKIKKTWKQRESTGFVGALLLVTMPNSYLLAPIIFNTNRKLGGHRNRIPGWEGPDCLTHFCWLYDLSIHVS